MSKATFKSIFFSLIVGFLASGCYTQLKITDTDTDKEEASHELAGTPIIPNYYPFYSYNADPLYYRFLYPMYSYGFGYESFYENIYGVGIIANASIGGEKRDQIRSSGLYSSGERFDKRSREGGRSETRINYEASRSGISNQQHESSSEQYVTRQSEEKVRSRATTLANRKSNSDTQKVNDTNSQSSSNRLKDNARNNVEAVKNASIPRRSIKTMSIQERTSASHSVVIQNRLRTVATTSQEWNTDIYNVPVADFDIWKQWTRGQGYYSGSGTSIGQSSGNYRSRGSNSNNVSYRSSNQSTNSSTLKSSSGRSKSGSSVKRIRSSTDSNDGRNRSSSSNKKRSSGSNN